MRHILFVVAILAAGTTYAQKMTIRGQLLDSAGVSLPSATVLLLSPADSSLVNFGVTNADGFFELKNLNRGTYLFRVTFVGYRTITKRVNPETDQQDINLGVLRMDAASRELDEVVIEAERAPVVVKKDTIEFNASSFKTQQNAMVEDLLKKLPGVEVDQDGNIDAQGERVQRVTVDGREFFGRDPKIATRNLPADAVDKVQVFDKKSDQALFTGIDDGQKEKTINLELKEEKRKGAFGNIIGGYGTDDRFNAKVSVNKFGKTRQFSLLGMGNNVNEQGFSIDDYMNFTGGSAQMISGGGMRITVGGGGNNIPLNFGGRSNGIMTNYAGGLNFNNDFSKKTKLTSNYFVNYLDHFTLQTTQRDYLFEDPTRNTSFNQNSRQNNSNLNHRANLTLDHELDSANSIKLTTGISYNETDAETRSYSETLSADPNAPNPVLNSSDQRNSSTGTTTRFNSDLLLRHKFKTKGRTLSSNLTFSTNQTDREGFLQADNTYGNISEMLNQRNEQGNNTMSYGANFSYTEPLGNRKYLEFNYNLSRNENEILREVFDIDNNENETRNETLSNHYETTYQYQRAGLNLRVNRKNYNFTLGSSFQYTGLDGLVQASDTATIDRTFRNLLPVARFNYDFSSTKHLSFEYETSVQEPTIQQLQPFADNSDPLNIYVGNPTLRPTYSQNWSLRFNTFNPLSFIGFFSTVNFTYEKNGIVNAQAYSAEGIRTTMPMNVDHTMSTRANFNLSFPINKIKSRINLSTSYRNTQSVALVFTESDATENNTIQNTYGGSVRYNYRYKEILDVTLSTQFSYQTTDYETNQEDQTYLNQTQSAQMNLTFLKNYQLGGDFDYMRYRSQTTGFSQAIPILNLSISRFLLKNNVGELKFSVNNALDRTLGITQTAAANYFEIQTINSLGRYYMVTFTYALNKHLNPMGGRRGGFRIMRQ